MLAEEKAVAPPPPPKPDEPDAAASKALGLFGAKAGSRTRKTSKETIPISPRSPRNSAADQAAAAAGSMASEVELETVASGDGEAAGGGWGLGEAPLADTLSSLAAQEAEAFRLIDMVEIFDQVG